MTDPREITAESLDKAAEYVLFHKDEQFGWQWEKTAELYDAAAHTLRKREAEILRLRTTETAAAHALDVLRQGCGLELIDGEHPADTGKRIGKRIRELEAKLREAYDALELEGLVTDSFADWLKGGGE